MEPDKFNEREKWLHLARLVPLVENNYNFCELGPRGEQVNPMYIRKFLLIPYWFQVDKLL